MPSAINSSGYSRISIIAHWIAAALIIILFLTHEGERGSLERVIHASGGAVAGLFLLWRVWHRLRRGFADKPDQAPIFNITSKIVIGGFLLSIIVVVLTGYLIPWSRGAPLEIFNLISIPSPMTGSRAFHEIMEQVHEISGQLFIPLLALHLLGVVKHKFIDKDNIAKRMFKSVSSGR